MTLRPPLFLTVLFALGCAAVEARTAAPAAPIASAPVVAHAGSAFRVEVVGAGPPMILIPGLTCSGEVWAATAARYGDRYQLHILTLAGFAGEPAIDGPLLARVRDELIAYIRERQLERPVIVGHSLGGFMALWIAANAPDDVGAIVAVDGVPFLPALLDPETTATDTREGAAQLRARMARMSPQEFAAQNRASLAEMIKDPQDVDAVAQTAGRSDPAAVGEAIYELMVTDIRPMLDRVRVPVLMIAAAEYTTDEAGRAKVRERYQRQIAAVPHGRVVLATAARHFVMLDDPSFFFAELDRFLAEEWTP